MEYICLDLRVVVTIRQIIKHFTWPRMMNYYSNCTRKTLVIFTVNKIVKIKKRFHYYAIEDLDGMDM